MKRQIPIRTRATNQQTNHIVFVSVPTCNWRCCFCHVTDEPKVVVVSANRLNDSFQQSDDFLFFQMIFTAIWLINNELNLMNFIIWQRTWTIINSRVYCLFHTTRFLQWLKCWNQMHMKIINLNDESETMS